VTDVAGDVKRRRPYRSERRREQAEQTRTRVLDAAATMFQERGYEGASIAAIASLAGVSAETVYAGFSTKRALLGELVERAVRGDDPKPVPEQAGPQALAAAADQREQLRLFAADITARLERAAPLVAVVSGAAQAEPELAELLRRLHAQRLRNLRILVDALAANGPLRLPATEAVETVWALTSPELHQLLVRARGWKGPRYAGWLADSLAALLLPSA
jgi:AcrR family transcriptional regulator